MSSFDTESKSKSLTLFMPNGEVFKTYPHILAHNTENGLLAFRFERKPGDRTTIAKIITNFPFILEDDTA
jgi:hypothetical protein